MYVEEYLELNKDNKLTRDNFNEVDASILALITLINMDYVPVNEEDAISLKECIDRYIKDEGVHKLGFLIPLDMTKFLVKVSKSKRFRSLRIFGKYLNISTEEETQTTILEAKIDKSTTIVIFGGTDDTIIGWKEDLNISYINKVPCMIHAEEYINKLPLDRDYIFVGHSKGGLESLYAGVTAERFGDKLIHTYAFDPPGFNLDVCELYKKSPLLNKITLLCPDSAVVGRLFYHPLKHQVTKSKDKGVMQHNPMGWEIEGTSFVRLKGFKKGTSGQADDVNRAARDITPENLKRFIDCAYKILSAGGSKTLTDIKKHILDVNITFFRMPREDKKNFARCLAYIINKDIIPKSIINESGFLIDAKRLLK